MEKVSSQVSSLACSLVIDLYDAYLLQQPVAFVNWPTTHAAGDLSREVSSGVAATKAGIARSNGQTCALMAMPSERRRSNGVDMFVRREDATLVASQCNYVSGIGVQGTRLVRERMERDNILMPIMKTNLEAVFWSEE